MRIQSFSFGSIRIDGVSYAHDVVIDRGEIRKRKKKPSKQYRNEFGHALSLEEKMPWKCRRLVIGTGTGALPVMNEVKHEAKHRRVELMIVPTCGSYRSLAEGCGGDKRNPARDVLIDLGWYSESPNLVGTA
ncbi:MAG TPA: hypothetical protein VG498_15975 [Terriglobales bacterium]|nr:hypothetical protein [Terriglobales bacterium]